MNFFNDEIHEEMLALYRDFATGVCAPIAAEIDEEEKFPVETFKQAAEMGLMGIPFPEEYGGAGLDELSYAQCIEEVSKVCASTSSVQKSRSRNIFLSSSAVRSSALSV